MKIKSTGFKVTDEESGIVFELIPKTEEANQDLVQKFFDSFQVAIVEPLKEERIKDTLPIKGTKGTSKLKGDKKPKTVKPKPEKKGIPKSLERLAKELTDLPEEFAIADIADLFEKEGFARKKIIENSYHDIDNLIEKNKIISIEGTRPKKYRIVSRDTSDLE